MVICVCRFSSLNSSFGIIVTTVVFTPYLLPLFSTPLHCPKLDDRFAGGCDAPGDDVVCRKVVTKTRKTRIKNRRAGDAENSASLSAPLVQNVVCKR